MLLELIFMRKPGTQAQQQRIFNQSTQQLIGISWNLRANSVVMSTSKQTKFQVFLNVMCHWNSF
jgi:hypothetical protein